MELGAHSFITKPISYQESLDIANAFLRFIVPVGK
jgi:FixJ family two-component response regulator